MAGSGCMFTKRGSQNQRRQPHNVTAYDKEKRNE
jgi:hypothetical protein